LIQYDFLFIPIEKNVDFKRQLLLAYVGHDSQILFISDQVCFPARLMENLVLLNGILRPVLFLEGVEFHGIVGETIVHRLHHKGEAVIWTEFLQ
jgi:hypothetical protein